MNKFFKVVVVCMIVLLFVLWIDTRYMLNAMCLDKNMWYYDQAELPGCVGYNNRIYFIHFVNGSYTFVDYEEYEFYDCAYGHCNGVRVIP